MTTARTFCLRRQPPLRAAVARSIWALDVEHRMFSFDHYTRPQYYGTVKSADLEHWHDISPQVSFPEGARQGTVLSVPKSLVTDL